MQSTYFLLMVQNNVRIVCLLHMPADYNMASYILLRLRRFVFKVSYPVWYLIQSRMGWLIRNLWWIVLFIHLKVMHVHMLLSRSSKIHTSEAWIGKNSYKYIWRLVLICLKILFFLLMISEILEIKIIRILLNYMFPWVIQVSHVSPWLRSRSPYETILLRVHQYISFQEVNLFWNLTYIKKSLSQF